MTVPHELAWILRQLEDSRLAYALTGSLAAVAWGRPRATYDADVVIALHERDIDALLRSFPPPAWYLDRAMIEQALQTGGEFNAIHGQTGTKVDFWLKSDSPVDNVRFARRRRETVAGIACWVLSPEDLILAKLQWLRAALSDRQQRDIAGILHVQADQLDHDYLRDWADRLDVRALLEQALAGDWD